MNRLAILVLALVAITLTAVIASESRHEKFRVQAPVPADVMRLGPVAPHTGSMSQVEAWTETILDRPLFTPSRRPPATAAGPGTSGPGFPRLTGIIIMPQQREAIFAMPGKTQPIEVRAGSRLNGVLIKSIEPGWVVVVDAAGARMIRPSFATGTASAAVATPSSPVMIDLPPVPSGPHASPFASIRGLSGRPLGLAAQPDTTPPDGGAINTAPSLPALAAPGGSP